MIIIKLQDKSALDRLREFNDQGANRAEVAVELLGPEGKLDRDDHVLRSSAAGIAIAF